MTDPNYHALIVVMDRSGSMTSIQREMESGLQAVVDEQAKLPGMTTVDLIQFDSIIEPVFVMEDAKNIKIKLEPRGATALYDALGVSINGFTKSIKDLPEHARPSNITLIAVTDGEENSSQEYDLETIRKLVSQKQKVDRWEFVFLGSNQDAVLSATSLGFQEDASLTFDGDAKGVRAMAQSAGRFVSDSRSGKRQGFSDAERKSASRRTM